MTIAQFEHVSQKQFEEDYRKNISAAGECPSVDTVMLPRRATAGSAGYDFMLPCDLTLDSGQGVTIPTGIRAKIQSGWVLMLFVRSSLGFRYRLQLDNTVGIIDSDYYQADNEGHIMIRITNDSKDGKIFVAQKGDRFAQGIFVPFGLAEEEKVSAGRTGGFGSTNFQTE